MHRPVSFLLIVLQSARMGDAVKESIPLPSVWTARGCFFVFCRQTEGLVAPSFAQIDMAIAQQNIWLETDALGLGGVWFGIAPMEDRMEEIHSLLELPENVKVFSMFALGYPAETRPQQNRFAPERIHFIEK